MTILWHVDSCKGWELTELCVGLVWFHNRIPCQCFLSGKCMFHNRLWVIYSQDYLHILQLHWFGKPRLVNDFLLSFANWGKYRRMNLPSASNFSLWWQDWKYENRVAHRNHWSWPIAIRRCWKRGQSHSSVRQNTARPSANQYPNLSPKTGCYHAQAVMHIAGLPDLHHGGINNWVARLSIAPRFEQLFSSCTCSHLMAS